jgi:histone-lysine N-methyltransferase SUV420H
VSFFTVSAIILFNTSPVGRNNSHCLCETCEKAGRGGYAPAQSDDEDDMALDSDSAVDSGSKATGSDEVDRKTKCALNLNERRTRRGVYAIIQEEDDESDESDEDETNMPLAEATDVPKDEEIELEADANSPSPLTSLSSSRSSSKLPLDSKPGLLTPDPDSVESSPSSQKSKPTSSESASSPNRNRSSPFMSIISTRRQKALAAGVSNSSAKQVVTPPLTDDTASLADASTSTLKRTTRSSVVSSVASNSTQNVVKAKETLPPRPSPSDDTGKEKEKVKPRRVNDEPETRILRARPSASTPSEYPKAAGDRKEIPRGCDGKPLPTCSTCSNILPVISVDSKVVWGLGVECSPRKGKKQKEQDCPRSVKRSSTFPPVPVNGINPYL